MGTETGLDADTLRAKIIGHIGNIISVEQFREALGLKASTYYDQVREGRLVAAENIITAARHFGINEVQLLVEAGIIDPQAAHNYNNPEPQKIADITRSRPESPDL